jgi:hypothetical protein
MQPATTESPAPVDTKKSLFWIFVIGLLGLALYLGINTFLRSSETASTEPEEAARSAERVKNLADVQAEETQKLTSFGWADKAKGEVRIPLELAMELVLPELDAKKPAPAYPILDATGQPMPADQDPAALPAEPAASTQETAPALTTPADAANPAPKKAQQ